MNGPRNLAHGRTARRCPDWVLGAHLRVRMSSAMRRRSGLMAGSEGGMTGLLVENEVDCLSHQHKHRRRRPLIRRQRRKGAPYRANGLGLLAIANDVGVSVIVRHLIGANPTFECRGGDTCERLLVAEC